MRSWSVLCWILEGAALQVSRALSVYSSLISGPFPSSCFGLQGFSALSPPILQSTSLALSEPLLPVPQSGQGTWPYRQEDGEIVGCTSFISHLSGITVLHCLMSMSWKLFHVFILFFSCFRQEGKSNPFYSVFPGMTVNIWVHIFPEFLSWVSVHFFAFVRIAPFYPFSSNMTLLPLLMENHFFHIQGSQMDQTITVTRHLIATECMWLRLAQSYTKSSSYYD